LLQIDDIVGNVAIARQHQAKGQLGHAREFLPGQLVTKMPRREAPSTSIVLYRRPRDDEAEVGTSNIASVTLVDRTTNTSAFDSRNREARDSSLRSGSLKTSTQRR